ncbi:hypothetical protein [Dyadobacter diqingensis]|uniref:hypothetical protein n=1 Tax=Dyadobacter diqingensis TaxID=2938121 RepID=UPI0020C18EE6|nr:hypothetical protein [Dyadobacter diqingensis]
MLLSLIKYIKTLQYNALYYESIDINGKVDDSKFNKYLVRVIVGIISVSITVCIDKGFGSDFVSYFSSVLSILVGLFITALVFSFDKFYVPKDKNLKVYKINFDQFDEDDKEVNLKNYKIALKDVTEENAKQVLWDTQSFNYSKQFSYVTGYNIVLSIFLILLLALNTLFEDLGNIKLSEYHFVTDNISVTDVKTCLKLIIISAQRFFVLYFIGIVMYKTLFIVSSMVQYNVFKMKQ